MTIPLNSEFYDGLSVCLFNRSIVPIELMAWTRAACVPGVKAGEEQEIARETARVLGAL